MTTQYREELKQTNESENARPVVGVPDRHTTCAGLKTTVLDQWLRCTLLLKNKTSACASGKQKEHDEQFGSCTSLTVQHRTTY